MRKHHPLSATKPGLGKELVSPGRDANNHKLPLCGHLLSSSMRINTLRCPRDAASF